MSSVSEVGVQQACRQRYPAFHRAYSRQGMPHGNGCQPVFWNDGGAYRHSVRRSLFSYRVSPFMVCIPIILPSHSSVAWLSPESKQS